MKKILTVSLLMVVSFVFLPAGITSSQELTSLLAGKIIALDAGHGGTSLGATYPPNTGIDGTVYEKDVNISTVFALKTMLEGDGAIVVLTRECNEIIPRRKDRVDIAKQKCAELYDRECDVLVSVHHNGDTDETYDGMMVIYNNKEDLVLATALHDRLLASLFGNDSSYDEGHDKGGYGMTVYFTPASLTEGYYVTNKCEAELFRPGTISASDKQDCSEIKSDSGKPVYNFTGETAVLECGNLEDGTYHKLDYDYGVERVNQEAEALYQGLIDYFSSSPENGGGKCPPGNPDHKNCK